MSPSRCFVSIQLPLADLRVARSPSRRLPRPAWPDPEPGEEFIQKMGVVTTRRLGGSPIWLGEAAHCDFGRVARLRAVDGVRNVYQRCYGSRWGYRVEFGQLVPADFLATDLHTFGDIVLGQKLDFRDGRHPAIRRAWRSIAQAVETRTQREADRSVGAVLPGVPVLLIEEATEDAAVLTATLGVAWVSNQRIDVLRLSRPANHPDADQLRSTARQFRVAWLRAHNELEVLRVFLRAWNGQRLSASPELRDLLDDLGAGLNRWRRSGVNQSQLIAWRASQHPGELDELASFADLLVDESKGIARKIGLIVERARETSLADSLLARLQGSNTVQLFPTTVTIEGGTGIAVGTGATVITQPTSEPSIQQNGENDMDPVSLIVAALVAGAATGATGVASDAVKDAYAGLKAMIKRIFRNKGDSEGEQVVESAPSGSAADQAALKSRLTEQGVDQVAAVVEAAKKVLEAADPAGHAAGKYTVTVTGGTGVQVGEHNTINFGTNPAG